MMIYQIIWISIIGAGLVLYNMHIYAMAMSRDEYYNSIVHIESGSIRFILVGMIIANGVFFHQVWYHVFWLVLYSGIWFWIIYNLGYNYMHSDSLLHIGSAKSNTSSWFDKTFNKIILPAQALLLLTTILWYPVKIYGWIEPLVFRIGDNICDWIIAVMFVVFFAVLANKVYNKKI